MIWTNNWFRLWRNGPGLAWKPAGDPLIFSQRYGYTRTFVIFGWRFHFLKPIRISENTAPVWNQALEEEAAELAAELIMFIQRRANEEKDHETKSPGCDPSERPSRE